MGTHRTYRIPQNRPINCAIALSIALLLGPSLQFAANIFYDAVAQQNFNLHFSNHVITQGHIKKSRQSAPDSLLCLALGFAPAEAVEAADSFAEAAGFCPD